MAAIEIISIDDEFDTCDCCGKSNLKKTVNFRKIGEGDLTVYHYGVNCFAAYAHLSHHYTAKNAECIKYDYAKKEENRAKYKEAVDQADKEAIENNQQMFVVKKQDRQIGTFYSVCDERFINHLINNIGNHPNIVYRTNTH
jgi:hypothetical protein